MSNEDKKTPVSTPEKTPEVGGAPEVADKLGEMQRQGFRGTEIDQTPNENYTVPGVTSGKPTPETDAEQAKKSAR